MNPRVAAMRADPARRQYLRRENQVFPDTEVDK
jgi:hypothetical protein